MFFLFKTNHSIKGAQYEQIINSHSPFFVHSTGTYENKVCVFGKVMAVVAIFLAFLRLRATKKVALYGTIGFDVVCLSLAYLMNMNAFVYLIPLAIIELYVIWKLK